jgi:hypothetical protein
MDRPKHPKAQKEQQRDQKLGWTAKSGFSTRLFYI